MLYFEPENDEVLVHYTGYQSFVGIISNSELWASSILYMNDSSEYIGAGRIIASQISNADYFPEYSFSKLLFQALVNQHDDRTANYRALNICVISFSKSLDLLSQWRAYSRPAGVFIGIAKKRLEDRAKVQGFRLVRCLYKDEDKHSAIENMLVGFGKVNEAELRQYDIDQINSLSAGIGGKPARLVDLYFLALEQMSFVASTFKHRGFDEENEWRLISEKSDSNQLDFRVSGDVLVPFRKFKLRSDDSDDKAIHMIGVGPSSNNSLNYSSVWALLRRYKYDCLVSTSGIPLRSFSI